MYVTFEKKVLSILLGLLFKGFLKDGGKPKNLSRGFDTGKLERSQIDSLRFYCRKLSLKNIHLIFEKKVVSILLGPSFNLFYISRFDMHFRV